MIRSIFVFALLATTAALAQSDKTGSDDEQRKQAHELTQKGRFAEALPIYKWLVVRYPNDIAIVEPYGFSLFASAVTESDPEKRKQMRAEAKKIMKRAQELGDKSNLVHVLDDMPDDGSESPFSARKEVDQAMQIAESSFAKGDYEDAIAGYLAVIQLDAKNYEAHLFLGDVFFKQQRYESAGEWFAKAIAIDPNRETAYRYWGDVYRFAGKSDEAKQKFIAAIVAEPYNRNSWMGLQQWADANHVKVGRPSIGIPEVTFNAKGDANVQITLDMLSKGKEDGSFYVITYPTCRSDWRKEKFKKTFPDAKTYRHTLAEEKDCLSNLAASLSSTKKLRPDLKQLVDFNKQEMLEAYILLAMPDQDIAKDYAAYRETHRETLSKFIATYMMQ